MSAPLSWDEVPDCDPAHYTLSTAPDRFAERGDAWAEYFDSPPGSLDLLLELADQRMTPRKKREPKPLIEIARAGSKDEAMAGLERWKARHGGVWALLEPADVLVDGMRGRSSLWYRIRLNLEHVPEAQRPEQEPLEVDFDPWASFRNEDGSLPSRRDIMP